MIVNVRDKVVTLDGCSGVVVTTQYDRNRLDQLVGVLDSNGKLHFFWGVEIAHVISE